MTSRRYAPPEVCDTREEQDAYYRDVDRGYDERPTRAELDADERD